MPETEQMLAPPMQWAQRKSAVFLTICLEDCKEPLIKLEPTKLFFKGKGGTDKKEYEVTLNFFKEVNATDSKYVVRDRVIEFIIKKKEEGPFWKRLLKDEKKYHWLKVDFNKWKDEDESDDELGGNQDLEEMMRQMGGLGGAGDKPSLEDLDTGIDGEDSDDEELPDLE
uniref:CS domain-containing protein n=1 Tax=Strigamia maritima TaxID=126957 RepID=T1JH99_STRMM